MSLQNAALRWIVKHWRTLSAAAVFLVFAAYGTHRAMSSKPEALGHPGKPSVNAAAGQSSGRPLQRVEVVEIGQQELPALTTYPGTLKAAETVALAFRVSGPLEEVSIKPGDRVAHGDVLMRIDPRDFENAVSAATAALDSATAKLSAMKAGARTEDLRALEAKMDSAVARRKYLKAVFERNERLLVKNAVSRTDFDASQSALTSIEADIRALAQEIQKARTGSRREDIQAMEADIRGMETQLKIARDQLDDTVLRAPFDGVITRQLAENHEQVAAGRTVLCMHDVSTLEIEVALPEKEVLHRSLDRPFDVTVRLVALPGRSFTATFAEINTEADPATRTYLVRFSMAAPTDVNLFPGMIADVTLPSRADGAAAEGALTVPAAAVRSENSGGRFAWVLQGQTVRRRPITVGSLLETGHYLVLDGLSPGERVVTGGAAFLHEGAQVAVTAKPNAHPNSRITHSARFRAAR